MKAQEKLAEVYTTLRSRGRVTTKKDFAELLGVAYTTLVAAMNGSEKYDSPKLIARAQALVLDEPAPAPPQQKELVIPAETLELYNNLSRTVQQQAEIIASLLGGSEQKKRAE